MTIELLFNLIFFVFFGYCLIDSFKLANVTKSDYLGSAFWPQLVLVLLLLCFAWNIYKIIRKNKQNPENAKKINLAVFKDFFTSKMFFGMVIAAAMALLLEPLGFIPAAFLFLAAYAVLLGERKWWKVLLISLLVTILLYLVFQKGLSIYLPRGKWFFRDFALWIEALLRGGR